MALVENLIEEDPEYACILGLDQDRPSSQSLANQQQ
jgi:hypothetical protein